MCWNYTIHKGLELGYPRTRHASTRELLPKPGGEPYPVPQRAPGEAPGLLSLRTLPALPRLTRGMPREPSAKRQRKETKGYTKSTPRDGWTGGHSSPQPGWRRQPSLTPQGRCCCACPRRTPPSRALGKRGTAAVSDLNLWGSKYQQRSLINYSKSLLLEYFIISEILEVFQFLQIEYSYFLFHYNWENFHYFLI